MRLRITAYAISRMFDMTSRPGQPQLALRYWLLLFHPMIDTPQCLQGRIWALKAQTLGILVFPVQKGYGFAITVTHGCNICGFPIGNGLKKPLKSVPVDCNASQKLLIFHMCLKFL